MSAPERSLERVAGEIGESISVLHTVAAVLGEIDAGDAGHAVIALLKANDELQELYGELTDLEFRIQHRSRNAASNELQRRLEQLEHEAERMTGDELIRALHRDSYAVGQYADDGFHVVARDLTHKGLACFYARIRFIEEVERVEETQR
jgi:hypothetical protein